MIFGGKLFYLMRSFLRLCVALAVTNFWFAYLRLNASDYIFFTRKLSNDENGMPTYLRPEDLQIRSEATWSMVLQIAAIAIAREVWSRSDLKSETELGNPS